jgi:hypothetical protein
MADLYAEFLKALPGAALGFAFGLLGAVLANKFAMKRRIYSTNTRYSPLFSLGTEKEKLKILAQKSILTGAEEDQNVMESISEAYSHMISVSNVGNQETKEMKMFIDLDESAKIIDSSATASKSTVQEAGVVSGGRNSFFVNMKFLNPGDSVVVRLVSAFNKNAARCNVKVECEGWEPLSVVTKIRLASFPVIVLLLGVATTALVVPGTVQRWYVSLGPDLINSLGGKIVESVTKTHIIEWQITPQIIIYAVIAALAIWLLISVLRR